MDWAPWWTHEYQLSLRPNMNSWISAEGQRVNVWLLKWGWLLYLQPATQMPILCLSWTSNRLRGFLRHAAFTETALKKEDRGSRFTSLPTITTLTPPSRTTSATRAPAASILGRGHKGCPMELPLLVYSVVSRGFKGENMRSYTTRSAVQIIKQYAFFNEGKVTRGNRTCLQLTELLTEHLASASTDLRLNWRRDVPLQKPRCSFPRRAQR